MRSSELEAAILADRSQERPWLVYADFLQERGDPRGELAALQARPRDSKLARAANELLWERKDVFFGPLVPVLAPFRVERWRAVTASWRHGFMDTLRLAAERGESSTRLARSGKKPPVVVFTLGHPRLAEAFARQRLPARFRTMPVYVYEKDFDGQCTLFERLREGKIPARTDKALQRILKEMDMIGLHVLPMKGAGGTQAGYHFKASLDDVKRSFEADGFKVVQLDEVYSRVDDVPSVDGLVSLLPKVASARLLRELILGRCCDLGPNDFAPSVGALVKAAPSLQSLERIFIGDFTPQECEISWSSLGDATPIFKAFPRLKSLTLRAGKIALSAIKHDQLEALEVISGGLARQTLQSIAKARLPRLSSLSVWTGDNNYGGTCRAVDLEALIQSPVLAHVKHLGIKNCEFGDEVVALLAKSKVLSQLESLDVSKSHLTLAAVDTITANAKAFSKLKRLDVQDGLLPRNTERRLKGVVKNVLFGKQHPDWLDDAEGMRYAAVGE